MNNRFIRNLNLYEITALVFFPFIIFISQLLDKKKSKLLSAAAVALIVFIGFITVPTGDLENYAADYTKSSRESLIDLIYELFSLNEGKFFIKASAIIFSFFFESYHYYFAFLFFVFGYFFVQTLTLVYRQSEVLFLGNWRNYLFVCAALFFSLRNVLSLPFYIGVIYILWNLYSYNLTQRKIYLFYLLLTPLFHIAHLLSLIPILLFYLVRSRKWICFYIAILSFVIPKGSITGALSGFVEQSESTLMTQKFDTYASEDGSARLTKRYELGRQNSNIKLKALLTLRDLIFEFLMPLLLGLISWYYLKQNSISTRIYYLINLALLFFALSNLISEISNASRYQIFFSMLVLFSLFDILSASISTIFKFWIKSNIVVFLIYGIMSLYACNEFIPVKIFFSNIPIEMILSYYEEIN